ncbi:MAG: saccharopine dehydrogenase [Phycisphaerae bacterium]
MAHFLIIGAGRQGIACGWFLLNRFPEARVAYVDLDRQRLEAARRMGVDADRIMTQAHDLDSASTGLESLVEDCDCVVACVPFFHNEDLTRLAIRHRRHFCDLGGNIATVRRQLALGQAAEAAGVTVVPDCGLAPGAVNVLAEMWRHDWRYRSVKIFCGGLPQHPRGVLRYQSTFSIHGLLNEYLDDCQVSRGGRVVSIEGLSEPETVTGLLLPGEFEAFATSGGASLAPEIYAPAGIDYEYKTLRYPGHRDVIKAMAEIGLLDIRTVMVRPAATADASRASPAVPIAPRDLTLSLLEGALQSDRRDLVVACVLVEGVKGSQPVQGRVDWLDYPDARFTAMERTTGFSAGIAAAFVAGLLPEQAPPGAFAPFQILPPHRLLEELRRTGTNLQVTSSCTPAAD